MNQEIQSILARVDHTLLAQSATWNEIKAICDDGIKYGCASVCIPASYVKRAAEYVDGKVAICTVIGFPNGYDTTAAKCFEAEDAVNNGASEVDMVINIGWVKDGLYDQVLEEIRAVKAACHAGGQRIRAIQGKDICVVFQEPMSAMDPTMRIGKQVEECLRVHTDLSAQERRQRALQALRDVELPDPEGVYRKYPHELSGGMLQRVMIAAAIVARPRLLLADEPTTALDVTIQAQILALLKRLNREMGMSILFISHNLHVVRKLCTRVAVMEKGRIVETGPVDQIFFHPQAPYTQRLIAAIPTRRKL